MQYLDDASQERVWMVKRHALESFFHNHSKLFHGVDNLERRCDLDPHQQHFDGEGVEVLPCNCPLRTYPAKWEDFMSWFDITICGGGDVGTVEEIEKKAQEMVEFHGQEGIASRVAVFCEIAASLKGFNYRKVEQWWDVACDWYGTSEAVADAFYRFWFGYFQRFYEKELTCEGKMRLLFLLAPCVYHMSVRDWNELAAMSPEGALRAYLYSPFILGKDEGSKMLDALRFNVWREYDNRLITAFGYYLLLFNELTTLSKTFKF